LVVGLVVAGCGDKEKKTVTEQTSTPTTPSTPTTTSTPSTETSTTPAGGDSMGTVPDDASSGGAFDATQDKVLRAIEGKVETAASANGLSHVVAHCSADAPDQVTCTVTGTTSSGAQGDETDVIKVDQDTGDLTLVSQQ
jgi:hypothetical protein